MVGPSAGSAPDVCRVKVSQRCASETGPVREKRMVPAGETANGLLSGKPSISARTGSMALALDTTDISATGNREDCGASRRFGESDHSRPTGNGQIGCFLSGKVARRQRKKENASVAQGLEFVRATTDVLVSCENQPAMATRFREPFLVRRVVGKDIPVRDERNVGGAKGAIKLCAPGVAINEERECLRQRRVAQSAELLRFRQWRPGNPPPSPESSRPLQNDSR